MVAIKIEPITEAEKLLWPKKPVVKLDEPHEDIRGKIQPLVDLMMKSAILIDSKAGSVRAQHFHKTDWHYCYVVSGQMDYYHRPTGSETPPEMISVSQGQMVFTPPMVDHAMRFPIDTVFLTLSRNPRDQESYEADVVRIEMIDTTGAITWKPGP